MQDASIYQKDNIREQSSISSDTGALPIHSYLDSQIELFNRKMDEIELRTYSPKEDQDELFKLTTKALIDLSYVCEEFEHQFLSLIHI